MLLTVRDYERRYRIEVPDQCQIKLNYRGTDYLLVPDPDEPDVPYWLWDDLLISAARDKDFGLRMISEELLCCSKN